jgi:2',3'-cyclic-nucleotide 2'-phosphodiesterase (5'-nucleotidase family)
MKKLNLLLVFVFILCSIALSAATRLRILHSNDIHARFLPFASKRYGKSVSGAVRRANLIRILKQKTPQALVLDAGDLFQGTPFFNFFKGEACFRVAKASGYDATTLGNHEPDLGLENLLEQLQVSGIRLLCCNVFYKNNDKPAFQPYQVFRRKGRNIAVIGSIGDEAWAGIGVKCKAKLYARPQIKTVREYVQRIRDYVDLIIVLSHAGFECDKLMAARVPEIDIILGGHSHTELFEPVLIKNTADSSSCKNGLNGTIVAQAGKYGIFLGILDLILEDNGTISSYSGHLELIDEKYERKKTGKVALMVDYYNKQLEDEMSKVAGYSKLPLSYPKKQKEDHLLPMGTFTANAMKEATNADICLVNSGGIRTGIQAGEISKRAVFEALPYDNTAVNFLMTGKQLNAMLQYICSNYIELEGYQWAGISGKMNLVNNKLENILVNGEPIDNKKVYRVCTSSFVANGNLGGDKLFESVEGIDDSKIFMREAAIQFIERQQNLPDFSTNDLNLITR